MSGLSLEMPIVSLFLIFNEIINTALIFLPDSFSLSSNMLNDQDQLRELGNAAVKETEAKMNYRKREVIDLNPKFVLQYKIILFMTLTSTVLI